MKKQSDKYSRLVSNTLLFGISTFSSKVLSFALTRLYTGVLTEAGFGVVNLVTISANLLIPLVSLGISNAVIRFGLEKGVAKSGVFTCGLVAIGMGYAAMLLALPLIGRVPSVSGYTLLLYVYVPVSCLRTLCCQFVRARMYTRLYAVDGILSTAYTVGFNLLFLLALKMGPQGYLLSVICADALSAAGLCLIAALPRHIRFRAFSLGLFSQMLRYSLPLVPALMFWWVTASSDQFFISYMSSLADNGLYAAAYKVPTIVSIFSTIFTEAWQLSAVTEGRGRERGQFFSNIFAALAGVAFLAGGALIFGCRLIMRFLVAPGFYTAWKYIPFLVMATIFSCLAAYLNSIYMVEKRSGRSLLTMTAGAAANLILNWVLIRNYGPGGAALATFLSYLLVFVIRAADTRRFIAINCRPFHLLGSTAVLAAMCLAVIGEVHLWPLWCVLGFIPLLALNGVPLYRGFAQLLKNRFGPSENTQ